MKLFEAYTEWEAALVSEGTRPSTLRNYRAHLRATVFSIAAALEQPADELDLTAWSSSALRQALASYRTRPDARFSKDGPTERSTASLRARAAALRSFTKFCLAEGYLTVDPLARVRTPPSPAPAPSTLSSAQVTAIRDAASATPRDALVIELMLGLGCALGELATCELSSWDRAGTLTLAGKRGVPRTLALTSSQLELMDAWLVERERWLEATGLTSNRLLLARGRTSMSPDGLAAAVERVLRRAGCEGVSSHALRVSYAQRALAGGANVGLVREVLGIDSLAALRQMVPVSTGVLTPPVA